MLAYVVSGYPKYDALEKKGVPEINLFTETGDYFSDRDSEYKIILNNFKSINIDQSETIDDVLYNLKCIERIMGKLGYKDTIWIFDIFTKYDYDNVSRVDYIKSCNLSNDLLWFLETYNNDLKKIVKSKLEDLLKKEPIDNNKISEEHELDLGEDIPMSKIELGNTLNINDPVIIGFASDDIKFNMQVFNYEYEGKFFIIQLYEKNNDLGLGMFMCENRGQFKNCDYFIYINEEEINTYPIKIIKSDESFNIVSKGKKVLGDNGEISHVDFSFNYDNIDIKSSLISLDIEDNEDSEINYNYGLVSDRKIIKKTTLGIIEI